MLPLEIGDRVAGATHGVKSNNKESGAFAEYCIAKAGMVVKLTDAVSDAEAACYGIGFITIGQGLYQSLQLPWPGQSPAPGTTVLVYGGSTGMGIFALQMARLSGLRVVTTCSPRNFDFCRRLGADACFDYRDPACAAQIRDATADGLMYAFDTISEGEAPRICAQSLSSKPGVRYSALLPSGPQSLGREDAALSASTLGYTASGEAFNVFGAELPAKPEDYEFSKKWMAVCQELANSRKFKVDVKVREGGLDGVFGGLDDLKEGRVSAEKLVYKV